MSKAFYAGLAFWGCAAVFFYFLFARPRVHTAKISSWGRRESRVTLCVVLIVCLVCILPMALPPHWSGSEYPNTWLPQYEELARSFLNGHLYLDREVPPQLLALENPYDRPARLALGIPEELELVWDHAFYNGHYYMYFGVVPVLLLFLPYRILTGADLTGYHATQIFTVFLIVGIFALFRLLARRFFPKLSVAAYLALASAFSLMSVWYFVDAPSLYCTAIASAVCMEVWSLFFFVRAVYIELDEKRSILYAFAGSLLGALAFGCRPPVALANLLVLPMLAEYLRRHRFTKRLLGGLAFAASPYLVIGGLLMLYNYLRFDSPFEFGQAYQLTMVDQSGYGDVLSRIDVGAGLRAVWTSLFDRVKFSSMFPYISFGGCFLYFPVLLCIPLGLLSRRVRAGLREARLLPFWIGGILAVFCIIFSQALFSPVMVERYKTDFYWLLGILAFLVLGFWGERVPPRREKIYSRCLCFLAVLTAVASVLLYFLPNDLNYTTYFPTVLLQIDRILKVRFY